MDVDQTNPDAAATPTETPDVRNERGAVALEWALLLGGMALPAYFVLKLALALLAGHYRMMTTLNSLPFP